MLPASVTLPRRVLLTLDAVGGVWRYTLDLARSLDARGVACLLVGFGPQPAGHPDIGLAQGALTLLDGPLDWMADNAQSLQAGALALDKLARDWAADLLHLNLPSQAALLTSDQPVIVAAHSCLPTWWAAVRGTALPPDWEWQRALNRRGFDRADFVLVPSASHGRALTDAYGPIASCRVVANATNVAAAATETEKQDFALAAGRWWDEGKNGAVLDEAAARSPWPIIMAGPLAGPNGTGIALAHAGAPGEVSPQALRGLMRRAGIFVAPSLYEPFGLAVLEAATCGAALVLADIATFRELWDGAALFVPPGSAAAYAGAIADLASAPDKRRALGESARMRAANFTPGRQITAILALYAEALAKGGRRVTRAA